MSIQFSFLKTQASFSFCFFNQFILFFLVQSGYQGPDMGSCVFSGPFLLYRGLGRGCLGITASRTVSC